MIIRNRCIPVYAIYASLAVFKKGRYCAYVKTSIIHLCANAFDETVHEAVSRIRNEEVVIFPTETVYGIGADAFSETAVARIFEAKGRPSDNPLIVHIADEAMLLRVAHKVSIAEKRLMDAFWPGPLTLILEKREAVPNAVTGGLSTVAVRMPRHPFAQALIQEAGTPIAAPSANVSGRPSGTHLEALTEDFDGVVPLIIYAGPTEHGLESTVVRVYEDEVVILRPGTVSPEMLQQVSHLPIRFGSAKEGAASPGTRYKHYAPTARVETASTVEEQLVRYKEAQAAGERVALFMWNEDVLLAKDALVFPLGPRNDLASYAHHLYQYLREADAQKATLIIVPKVAREGIGTALMNRIEKAASI